MEYGLIFHGTRTVKYYCKNMKYRINIIIVCGQKIYLNRTLAIDLPFQTFVVGLLVEFIDWF